jgi:phosphopantothenoylcysteine decarboxylase/phosphopantothenate--cysteine ligase
MHTEMWEHEATRANVATLRARGALVHAPASGRLTGTDTGPGRLPDPDEIFTACTSILRRSRSGRDSADHADLRGRRVLISAGGTREHLDPVRFLGNRSSGRQGHALARTAAARGAEVILVAANVTLPDPAGVTVVPVRSAADLREAVLAKAADADVVVMAAAVADFRPASRRTSKIKKEGGVPAPIELEATDDVLTELAATRREGQVIVGFAAETDDVLAHGRAKLARKGADLLVVNEVGETRGFESVDNAAVILGSDGAQIDVPLGPKEALAVAVWDAALARLAPVARPVTGGH